MEFKGELADIIYKNEINSYTIATFETEEELLTIVGYLPFVSSGDNLKIIGKYVEHKEYGRQFQIETFEKLMPQTLGALEKYLSNGEIKGIGEITAKKIIDKFGEETIHVFKYEYKRLAQIKGITLKKAQEMSESFIEHWEVWQIVGFLERFGIGAEHAKKVYDMFGIKAIEEIEANPYILIDIARGVDFKQIDKMALDLGIEYDNSKRVKSGIKYGLIRATYNGNCCVLKENLIEFVVTILDVTKENVENNLINLSVTNEIEIENQENETWIYLSNFYNAELEIALKIMNLNKAKNTKKISGLNSKIEKIQKDLNFELSDKQKKAIEAVNDNNVTIITGGPGTGKTTIIRTIIELYKEEKNKIILCAPTGRAAKKMTEATGEEASTLHRLLEIGKIDDDGIYKKSIEYQGAPIDADIIVVDEMSMVDTFLMSYLLSCIYQGTKLILVGDYDQLASVGPGSVLKDIIKSQAVTTIHLEKIFRQAAKSKIVLNAHRVNNGERFLQKIEEETLEETKQDFYYIKEQSQDKMLEEIISLCTGRLKKFGKYDFFQNIQVMTPTKKGILGTKQLNIKLQEELNPNTNNLPEKSNSGVIYRVGDRIMQIKNNYDMYWERNKETEVQKEIGSGVFNGEIGTIEKVNEREKLVQIKFDDEKIAWYAFSELDQIEHSYAITIHKAQGSEYDVVIMVIPQSAPMLLTRNLLYTGITRAKKLLIVIGNDRIIDYMIKNVESKKRNTGLEYKMKQLKKGETV